ENIEYSVSLFGGRRRRVSEIGLIASDFDEAARASSDGLRKADQLRFQRHSYLFARQLRPRAQHQRTLVLSRVAGAALKLLGQHLGPPAPRDIRESDLDAGLGIDRFTGRPQSGDVRQF